MFKGLYFVGLARGSFVMKSKPREVLVLGRSNSRMHTFFRVGVLRQLIKLHALSHGHARRSEYQPTR